MSPYSSAHDEWLIMKLCMYVCVCVRDMSPYSSAHDEWLIMKLCMYVGYHTANNASNFGGDPVTQLHFKVIMRKQSTVLIHIFSQIHSKQRFRL